MASKKQPKRKGFAVLFQGVVGHKIENPIFYTMLEDNGDYDALQARICGIGDGFIHSVFNATGEKDYEAWKQANVTDKQVIEVEQLKEYCSEAGPLSFCAAHIITGDSAMHIFLSSAEEF